MWRSALVAAGGLAGALLRYWVAGAVQSWNGSLFPAGTLAVNAIGCFLVGAIMTLSLERAVIGADLRLLLTIGFCGGFTTMSTFGWETIALMRDGENALAAGNVLISVIGSLIAVWAGMQLGRAL